MFGNMLMITRATIFILVTLLSGIGLFGSFSMVMMLFWEPVALNYIFIASVLISLSTITAWFCYFRMGRLWVHNIQIPKNTAILGTIAGCICLVPTFVGAVFVFVSPAITLSCYMVYTALASNTE